MSNRVVAIGLLTERDVQLLGVDFDRLWSVDATPYFSQLLQAIDEADRELWRERDKERRKGPCRHRDRNKVLSWLEGHLRTNS